MKIGASYAGLSDFKDGATHYSISDLANMRALPGMTIIVPADAAEAAAWVPIVAEFDGPVYLRISRAGSLPVYKPGTNLEIGKGSDPAQWQRPDTCGNRRDGRTLRTGGRSIGATGIDARLLEIHTLKPLDHELLVKAARETGAIVTAEEHTIIGGLGSAVAETLAEAQPVPLERVGIQDRFCPTGRNLDTLMDACGLSVAEIVAAAKRVLERKQH